MKLAELGELAAAEKVIKDLQAKLAALSDAEDQITALKIDLAEARDEIAGLEATNSSLNDDLDDLNAKIEELEEAGDVTGAVDAFLDCCERVGPLRYVVPQSDRASQAIVALHDAIGATP